jgi:4-amino-4-deoxy-L-arabinose transferase-like glycosyltransferase
MTRRAWLFLGLLAFALVWFGSLDYRKLIKPDEGRYAEIAREMAIGGDWVTPRLNGIKYFEKPPLQYWATAAAYRAFGENEWTARLWTALTGFLGVLLAGLTGRRLFGPAAGLLAAATLGSSLLYLMMGHINTLDMGLAFFLELALCGFLLGQQGSDGRRWMLAAWAGLALAVLSKGIVALVLTGGTLVLYSLLTRDLSPWRRLAPAAGSLLFLAIAAPWFVAVSIQNPEFPRFFFIHEHFERFLTTAHRRVEPAWYFIPIFLAGALPWTGPAIQALAGAWHGDRRGSFQPRRFLLLWCLVIFGFFSASGSKLPSYILPLFPALALLLGDFLPRAGDRGLRRHLALAAALALAALVLATRVAGLGSPETPAEMMAGYGRWLVAGAGLWLLAGVAALALLSARRSVALLVLAAGSLLAGMTVLLGHENLARSSSAHHIAGQVRPLIEPGVPFYSVRMHDQTLPFYLQRTLTLVDYRDEFDYGLQQEPTLAVDSLEAFKRRWLADGDAFAVMVQDNYDLLQNEGLPMTIIARDTRRIIVRKPR